MSTPLYQLKAEFFKTLGHPARIRVLELLSEREYAVAEMLPQVGIEPAHLSQQLAVLRRADLVTFPQGGPTADYSPAPPPEPRLLAAPPPTPPALPRAPAVLSAGLRPCPRPRACPPPPA